GPCGPCDASGIGTARVESVETLGGASHHASGASGWLGGASHHASGASGWLGGASHHASGASGWLGGASHHTRGAGQVAARASSLAWDATAQRSSAAAASPLSIALAAIAMDA